MDMGTGYAIVASVLISTGAVFCISKNTQPLGFGIMAGGATCVFIAALCLILGK